MSLLQLIGGALLAGLFVGGPLYCYFNYQFWTHKNTEGFYALQEYLASEMRGYRGRQILVHRSFVPTMERLSKYCQQAGVTILVTQSYRYSGKQVADAKVRPASRSNHLAGHAIDLNIYYQNRLFRFDDLKLGSWPLLPGPVKRFLKLVRQDKALRWGGDFRSEDPVHIDDGLNLYHPAMWKQHSHDSLKDIQQSTPKWMFWVRANDYKR